jgi:catechol 2,3-dioxygenase-like lactoylglutathione lyase family enzyme
MVGLWMREGAAMAKITGIGGVFFKAADLEATKAWYRDVLGLDGEWGANLIYRDAGPEAFAVFSPFKADTDYFDPSPHAVMINLRVDDLDAMLAELKAKGVEPLGYQTEPYGKFAWIMDPNGIKLELWEQIGPAPTS